MNKSLVLDLEEQKMQMRFDGRMTMVKKAIDMKNGVEHFAKVSPTIQLEVNTMESEETQKRIEIKMLETQRDEMDKNNQATLTIVLMMENEIKNFQDAYTEFLREKTKQTKECPLKNEANDNKASAETEKLEIAAQKRVWALRGEVEALELFADFQTKLLEKIGQIVNRVEEVFENVNPQKDDDLM